ncbi:cytochrome-c peroxidase [Sulfitobacter guttiformis]|uniref:Cytochrome c peroxidase n=1 Tax=Sulfitobacter guttiformis TaxID=74349 RepID=A0A420DI96_9RHOB|nr:cytochrome c peroxidase [Sulfitobacter guttiformis]KIN72293.1 Di-heme Cytochrome c peroxidase [Sulfitobacter guttiformis KCTC 32187]RKE93941.1 cytochrome c peroxidase [Sulfitobacter guttiformis]
MMMKRMLDAVCAGLLCTTAALAGPLPVAISDTDFHQFPPDLVELGRDLFFDPVLSGNKNIACATCHHPTLGTSDGMSLSVGEGGVGLGASRHVDMGNAPKARIPRNAPALFNLGAKEYTVMFHDGRTESDRHAMFGIRMPAGRTLEKPVVSALAAQNILPILSPDEMSGHPGENEVADAVAADRIMGDGGAWDILAKRIDSIPDYRTRFAAAGSPEIHITDIGTALSAFIGSEFRATQSPFDRYLAGEDAMSEEQLAGMDLFYGKARCSTCHSGAFQTDHNFHAIGMPQLGPGKDDYASDAGRGMVTKEAEDMYRFRTPTLRNITMTGPYGHNGAYANLEDIIRHHLDAVEGLASYDRTKAVLSRDVNVDDWKVMDDFDEVMRIAEAIEIIDVSLQQADIDKIMSFLGALTDEGAGKRGLGVPASVPSGLEMDVLSPPS